MITAVSAASGLLGRTILPLLTRASAGPVLALTRDPATLELANIEVRAGDYADPAQMEQSLQDVDTLLMISAPLVPGTDRLALHRNAIDAAARAGVRKIIYTSVIGRAAKPDMRYFPTQQVGRLTEAMVRDSGMNWVIARNGFYLDLDLNHIRRADTHGGIYRNNAGAGRCGYLSVAEIAAALARLTVTTMFDRQTVNICGPGITQTELVAAANEVFGLHVRYATCTAEERFHEFMQLPSYAKRGTDVVQMLVGCFECIAAGLFDVESDFERVTGRPPHSLQQQITDIRSADAASEDYRTANP